MKTGLTAGSGVGLGLLVGVVFFDDPALGMIFGLVLGAALAPAGRRRSAVPPSN